MNHLKVYSDIYCCGFFYNFQKDREPEGVPLDLRIKKTVNPVTKIVEEIQELVSDFKTYSFPSQ